MALASFRWKLIILRRDGVRQERRQDGLFLEVPRAQLGAFGALAAELQKGITSGRAPAVRAELSVETAEEVVVWGALVSLACDPPR